MTPNGTLSKIFNHQNKSERINLNERRICNNTGIFTKWLSLGEKNDADSTSYREKSLDSFRISP